MAAFCRRASIARAGLGSSCKLTLSAKTCAAKPTRGDLDVGCLTSASKIFST